MAKTSKSFRIEGHLNSRLKEAASASGMNVSNYIELAVIEKLGEKRRLSSEIKALQKRVDKFIEDWSLAMEAILVVIGSEEPLSPEEASKWVRENLRSNSNIL